MTPAALLLSLAGLSHREASDFLGVRLDTVKSWHRKINPSHASAGIIADLRLLIARQAQSADEQLALISASGADQVELGYPADDHEAQTIGWPCVGAWQAMAARVVANSPVPVRLVPRGSTAATAAAADAHGK